MNISYRWLQELIPGLTISAREVADMLAAQGAPVDELIDIGAPLRDIVIARVARAQKHPKADRLSVCEVEAGNGALLQVVCGAPNVRAGHYYPFAPVGASLPGGVTIGKATIRGQESQGMLCSARELGLGRDHEGILELHGEFEIGRSFIESLGLDDVRIVVDVTPNRSDLLSHIGIAREIAASVGATATLHAFPDTKPVPPIEPTGTSAHEAQASGVSVRIADPELCSRYFGLVIRGVQVAPSPEWLASRLRVLGLRPISNVVDATNWVLHELGQPLHAFDLDRLGAHVVVRRAQAGEHLTTLDGVDRVLSADMLMIADSTRPVAVAGVMGGADTEVQSDTTNLLLECAHFDPKSVRATRRALGLSTDASYRFERGVDPDAMSTALQRAAELIVTIAGGTVESRVAAPGPGLPATAPVTLRLARVEQVLGESFTAARVATLLAPLGFVVTETAQPDVLRVTVPSHRRYDVSREVDLIEDIARRHGYDAFADDLRPFRPSAVPTHPLFLREAQLRNILVRRGFLEARTAAFAPEQDGDVALLNPLAMTESRLRRALLPGLLRRVEHNFTRGARSIRLFEIGTVFAPAKEDSLPRETIRLAIALTGQRRPPHFSEPEASFDVWDLKDLASEIARELSLQLEPDADDALLESGLSFRLTDGHNEAVCGTAGQVRADRVDAPAWADPVWALEVDVAAAAPRELRYREPPSYPAIERDLALLVPDAVSAAVVDEAIQGAGEPLLEAAEAFDVYSGQGVPAGSRSLAFRLRFRAADRTLTDAEVDPVVKHILQRLEAAHGIQQRA